MEAALAARDVVGVEDFVLLEDYSNIAAFVDNLRKRFRESLIYVSSSQLAAEKLTRYSASQAGNMSKQLGRSSWFWHAGFFGFSYTVMRGHALLLQKKLRALASLFVSETMSKVVSGSDPDSGLDS